MHSYGLFQLGDFDLHSGYKTKWKIDAECLTDSELKALAKMASLLLPPFGSVRAVPRGGLRFAAALLEYVTTGPMLIVDDVLTTGASMEEATSDLTDDCFYLGVVIFARSKCPDWVTALFTVASGLMQ